MAPSWRMNSRQAAGRIAVSLEAGDGSRQKLAWKTDGVSLAIAEPWMRRAIVAAELSGTLSGQGAATWTNSESTCRPVDNRFVRH
jgi:hypothetical protein